MKTQNDIAQLENKLNSLLMSHDIKVGKPISKKKYSPLLGYEYDAISRTFVFVIPTAFKTTLFSLLKKNELENIYQHEIIEESGYIRATVYL
jgi:hypothetical protein